MHYKRILIKLSGQILASQQGLGIDQEACLTAAESLKALQDQGREVGVVIGGGNFFRGVNLSKEGFPRIPADQIGMLATLMNGIALQQTLISLGNPAALMSGLDCPRVAESFDWQRALLHLKRGEIVLFVGGTGNPFFSTDTAAALRASEIQADILLKATKVDGVYERDPLMHPEAKRFEKLSYGEFLAGGYQVMDGPAVALCRSNRIPLLVFHMQQLIEKKMDAVLSQDRQEGTLIQE